MWTKTFWIITAIICVALLGIFNYISANNNASERELAPKYWNEAGDFIYSGATVSDNSFTGSIFSGATTIESTKTLLSEKNFSPKYYIEYPNFSEIQNVDILANIRKTVVELAPQETTGSGFLAYSTKYSLLGNETTGSIFYQIYEHTDASIVEKERTFFHLNRAGKIFDSKKLINTEKKSDLINHILSKFSEKFPNEKTKSSEMLLHNIGNYLEKPEFAFSGSEVIFSIERNNFVDHESKLTKFVELEIPYENLQNIVYLEPKPEPKPVTNSAKKTKESSDGRKYVALTFDDGPGKFTNELLATLKEKNVRATFFILGQNVSGREWTLQWMDADGHEIANHSWSHPSFLKINTTEMRSQIEKTDQAIFDAIGKTPTLFRPPYGARNANTDKIVDKGIIMWSVDSFDWKNRNVQKNIKTTMNQVHDGAIILYHDIHKPSVDTIWPLIDELRKAGYEFLTVSEMYAKYYENTSILPEQLCYSMQRCD